MKPLKSLIITTRIVLDPDAVQDAGENGATDDDIKREVKEHLSSAIGNKGILNTGYILEAETLDITEED